MKIENGNIVLSSSGIPVTLSGEELALQKAEILLTVPKGSFIFDRDFGSRIHEMEPGERENPNALLFEYALEVTEKIPGVKIIDTQYTPGKGIITLACGEKNQGGDSGAQLLNMTQQITYDGLLSLMKEKYTEITGVKPEDSGDIEIRMKLLAGELFSLYSRIAGLESRIFPDTAVGIDLERHGAQRGIYRKTASTASGEIDFIIDEKAEFDIVIPEKTVCAIAAEDVCQYVTTKEAVLTAGETKVTVPAEATIEGRDGNCAAEKITVMITPPVGIDRVINPSPFTGGGNSESDEALRKRILESWSVIPNGSNPITYTEIALTFEDVLKAKTVPVNRGAGTVDVIVVAKDGKYNIDLERAIYVKLKSYCPAGIDLKVKEAEQYGVSLSLLVKVKDNLDEENAIEICRERIEDFFSDLQIGEEIRLCDLGKVLMEIDGIVNYRFLTPESDITPPADCEITLSDLTISGRFE